ncbi:MAG: CPBP family intramembrane metalloprotease [Lachnospiraceae bacterium]|nr:CPBP family intramembrane metalloprotease [Lachnospiraceae bacterium]
MEVKREETPEEKKADRNRILIFLGITFAVTYAVEILMVAPLVGSSDVNEAMMAQKLVAGIMFMPAFGALITRFVTKEGFAGRNLYITINLKGHLRYYGIVWPLFGGLIILGAALYFMLFPGCYDGSLGYAQAAFNAVAAEPYSAEQVRQIVMNQTIMGFLMAPFVNLVNCFGEEWGWRGYLLPKLLGRFKVVPAVLLNGLIWGLWHAPLIALGHNYGIGYPGFPVVGILAMCVFCVVMGTILCYVTIKTRSCIPAVMGHGMINGFSTVGVLFTSMEHPFNVFLGPTPVGLIGGAGFIALAAFLMWRLYKEEKNSLLFS